MLRLYKRPRDKIWKIRGSVNGVRIEESTGFTEKAAARQVLNARAAEIDRRHLEGIVLGRSPAKLFAEAVADYLEDDGAARFVQPLLDEFGSLTVDKITQELVDAAARKLYPNAAPATRNRQVYTPVSAILQKAGVAAKFRRPATPRAKEMTALTQEQASALISAAAPHLRPLIIFLLFTGARVGEALWLDWKYVSLGNAHVNFPKTKTGKPRGLPLHPDVIDALKALPHHEGEIFRRPDGKPYEGLSKTDGDDTSAGSRIKSAFKAACRRAGLSGVRVHDLRHTWATWHYEQNRDPIALMLAGGWTSLKMVERYTHRNRDELRPHINALPSLKPVEAAKMAGAKTGSAA